MDISSSSSDPEKQDLEKQHADHPSLTATNDHAFTQQPSLEATNPQDSHNNATGIYDPTFSPTTHHDPSAAMLHDKDHSNADPENRYPDEEYEIGYGSDHDHPRHSYEYTRGRGEPRPQPLSRHQSALSIVRMRSRRSGASGVGTGADGGRVSRTTTREGFGHPLFEEKTQKDALVDFDGKDDPYRPINWAWRKKAMTTILYGLTTAGITFASSVYSAAIPDVSNEFGVGEFKRCS